MDIAKSIAKEWMTEQTMKSGEEIQVSKRISWSLGVDIAEAIFPKAVDMDMHTKCYLLTRDAIEKWLGEQGHGPLMSDLNSKEEE